MLIFKLFLDLKIFFKGEIIEGNDIEFRLIWAFQLLLEISLALVETAIELNRTGAWVWKVKPNWQSTRWKNFESAASIETAFML